MIIKNISILVLLLFLSLNFVSAEEDFDTNENEKNIEYKKDIDYIRSNYKQKRYEFKQNYKNKNKEFIQNYKKNKTNQFKLELEPLKKALPEDIQEKLQELHEKKNKYTQTI